VNDLSSSLGRILIDPHWIDRSSIREQPIFCGWRCWCCASVHAPWRGGPCGQCYLIHLGWIS